MSYGHPLAARAVLVSDDTGALVTGCWACMVEDEIALEQAAMRGQNHGPSGKIDRAGVSGNHDSATMRTARIQVLTPPVSAPFVSPGVRR